MRSNKPGHRPEGNTACVEVVETSELLPDDVVWGEDGWYCVLEGEENDSIQIVAAPIIDDAGGQGESLMLYGETFLRVVGAPAAAAPAAREGAVPVGLRFGDLRAANVARLPLFKNGRGEPAHSEPDGSDWSLCEWLCAVAGELGEAANIAKKVLRGDLTLDEARPALLREFADVVTYLDLAAFRAGIDLGEAVRIKFNEVSKRVGCDVVLPVPTQRAPRAEARAERALGLLREARECMEGGGCRDGDCAVIDRICALLKEVSHEG